MIVVKDLRVNVLGESLFEKVNFVIRPLERVALVGSKEGDVATLLRVLSGEEEADRGTVATEGERIAYVSPDTYLGGAESLGRLHHARPTFIFFDATSAAADEKCIQETRRFIEAFRGGILIAATDERLIQAARTTRVLEMHITKEISSYSGTYANFLIEREKSLARLREAYEKQQREKQRLEEYLEQKRIEASKHNSSPEKGAIVRAKAKYLKREILDKEIPKPFGVE